MTPTEFIKHNQVFTLDDIAALTSSRQIAHNFLSLATKRGKAKRVRSGLYVSNAGRFEGAAASPYAIAARAFPGCVFCHCSAFSLFAGTQDVNLPVFAYVDGMRRGFAFEGRSYAPLPSPSYVLRTRRYPLVGGTSALGTTKEQTIVDALGRPRYCGGVEPAFRTLSAVRFADVDELAAIAAERGASSCSKLGWVLEHIDGRWGDDGEALALLEAIARTGPHYFTNREACRIYDKRWHLYLPDNADVMEEWLNG